MCLFYSSWCLYAPLFIAPSQAQEKGIFGKADQWLRASLPPASLHLQWSSLPGAPMQNNAQGFTHPTPHLYPLPNSTPTFVLLSSFHLALSVFLCVSLHFSPLLFLSLPLFSLSTLKGPFCFSLDTSHFLSHEINKGQICLGQAALAFSTAKIPGTHALYCSLKYKGAKHKLVTQKFFITVLPAFNNHLHISLLLSK